MSCTSPDLTIDAALADPMIAAAMRADGVDGRQFEHLLRRTARRLDGEPRPRYTAAACPPARIWAAARGCVAPW